MTEVACSTAAAAATSAPRRYDGLDALRAAAMLLGLAYHATYAYLPDVGRWYPVADPASSPVFTTLSGLLHAFRMHAFFALAGFFSHLLLERRGPRAFLADRARRLGWPFLVGLPLTWAADTGARRLSHHLGWMDPAYAPGTAVRWMPVHLWFLEYLLLYCALAAMLSSLGAARWARPLARAVEGALRVPELLVLLAVPTGLLLVACGEGKPDTSFLPELGTFGVMGLFYGFGFALWSARRAVGALAQRGPWMALAGLALGTWLFSSPLQWRPLGVALGGGVAWLVTLGALGAAFRVRARERPLVSLLVDSSYWVYLVHYPLVMVAQVALAPAPWPAIVKYGAVLVAVFACALGTYFLFVRGRWLASYLGARRAKEN